MTDTPNILQHWLQPQWPAVDGVHALFTTRYGGCSAAPFDTMNLGDHVRDDPLHVARNRARLQAVISEMTGQQAQPVFMQQVHGCEVQSLQATAVHGQAFDAAVTTTADVVCTVMVADCLPVLFAHRSGKAVAAAHAGWRGLVGQAGYGILEATWQALAQQLGRAPDVQLAAETQAWLGPCIGPQAFEVGAEVRAAFVEAKPEAARAFAAHPDRCDKWLANLPMLARQRLHALGLVHIYGNDASAPWCTVRNASQFFSHRRDAAVLGSTGRMAACIWMGGGSRP
ncbi:peptidoglycan editing factor PgeF [Comamonas sp.]